MKMRLIENGYSIYLAKEMLGDIDFSNKDVVAEQAKIVVIRLRKQFSIDLYGFYQMTIYVSSDIGIYITLEKIDEEDTYDLITIDLKVRVLLHQHFYLEVDDFSHFSKFSKFYIYCGKGYGLLDGNTPNDLYEFGSVVAGEKVKQIEFYGQLLSL